MPVGLDEVQPAVVPASLGVVLHPLPTQEMVAFKILCVHT